VGIKNIGHALACGIIAIFTGIIAAIFIAYWFFA
jgi:spore maturation protein SpmB